MGSWGLYLYIFYIFLRAGVLGFRGIYLVYLFEAWGPGVRGLGNFSPVQIHTLYFEVLHTYIYICIHIYTRFYTGSLLVGFARFWLAVSICSLLGLESSKVELLTFISRC